MIKTYITFLSSYKRIKTKTSVLRNKFCWSYEYTTTEKLNTGAILLLTSILRTSLGVFPSTLMPFTSHTSSPTWMSPERSAAPPCIIRAITIFPVSSSVFIVAPWWKNEFPTRNFKYEQHVQSLLKLRTLYQRLVLTLKYLKVRALCIM